MGTYYYDLPPMFWIAVAFLFGACAGSFANVCIYRMPMEMSIITPRSQCPTCKTILTWQENVPLISWLTLGARCKTCAAPISVRYPIVEMITGAVFALVMWRFGIALATPVYLAMTFAWVVLSGIDWDHQYIPDEINITGMILGPAIAAAAQFSPWPSGLIVDNFIESAAGLLVGGGVIWSIRFLGSAALRQEAMGFGDVKLMAFVGGFLGCKLVLISIFLASILGSIAGIFIKIMCRYAAAGQDRTAIAETERDAGECAVYEDGFDDAASDFSRYTRIPFGPYLVLGAFLTMLWGERLWSWYWDGLGGVLR